jgi:hypothetical protein
MIKKLLLFSLSFVISYAQGQDSLVFLKEINFADDHEKKAFTDYFLNKKPDYFLLFNQAGKKNPPESQERFYSFLQELEFEKWNDKKADKKVKFLYESIHKKFLSKYVATNLFSEIFINGEYNCVSATALYSLAFHHFNIPFSIKEDPTHVYPVAYPRNQQVIVETTNPMIGSFGFDQKFKMSYLERLKEQKLISVAEYGQSDVNQLFNKYFFKEQQEIDMDKLIGIQYMNDGIFKIEDNQFLASANQMEKAYLFYPSERIANGLLVAYFKAFQNQTVKNTNHAILLAKIARFKKNGITSEMVEGDFSKVIHELLFEKGKTDDCKTYCTTLLDLIKDTELKKDLEFIYQYEFGRYYYNKGSYLLSKPYFEKALLLKPSHQEIQGIYIGLLERTIKTTSDNKEILNILEQTMKTYPELETNTNFNSMVAASYLFEFMTSFQDNNAMDGEKFKGLFESQMAKFSDLNLNPYAIGQAYSTGASYYFRKNQNAKSKAFIKKGLEFAPGNRELLQRQKMIN